MANEQLLAVPPGSLVAVREMSHAAVQWPSRAARANLPALPDDSHSDLGWLDAEQALVSQHLDGAQRHQLGFSFATGSLLWLDGGAVVDTYAITSETEAQGWCDDLLSAHGLAPTTQADMPYVLEPVQYVELENSRAALATLGAWYAEAQKLLDGLVAEFGSHAVTPPTVRCWPHHFDLATLFFLDAGNPETARSVGVGLSPGDDSYAEPYFYCTPWPRPDVLGEASAGFRWHTDGFTSLVCQASSITPDTNLSGNLTAAVRRAFDLLG